VVPRADQAAAVVDTAAREVGAQVPTPASDREVPTPDIADGVTADTDHRARRQIDHRADSFLRTHR
jgi:hypothetical protein